VWLTLAADEVSNRQSGINNYGTALDAIHPIAS
jgi:hypothetical protein